MKNENYENTINQIFDVIENNFKLNQQKKIPFEEIYKMVEDVYVLLQNCEEDKKFCGITCIKRFIPLINLLIKGEKREEKLIFYEKCLKYAYKLGARVSLEHYMVYREWDEPEDEKFFEPRYNILIGYIHYLQLIETDPNFKVLIFNAPSGYGKLIANDVPVLTRNGWKKHGNLVVGDEVISPKGEFIKVTHIHPKRYANIKVTFEDGEEILCHNQHEWQVYDRLARKEKHIETNYMIDKFKTSDGFGKERNRFFMPLIDMVKGEKKDLPVDPYTYGVWLGNGSTCKSAITENVNDFEIFNHIPYEISSIYNGVSDKVKCYQMKCLAQDLHKLNLCYQKQKKEKYIHDMYLTASIEQRLELLAGLLDTDGCLDKSKNRYIFSTTSEKIKDGIVSLISTFNWRVSITKTEPKISSSGIIGRKPIYQIGFNPTMFIPCKLKRKQLHKFSKQKRIGISNIELIEPTQGNCISVEGGLYLVGKTLKMTHNTYPEKISEAWSYGAVDEKGTILSLCSNDDVVKGGSRTVINEIKSEKFGEVFPHLKWDKEDKDFFLKETDGNWKLRNCKMLASYYASTTNSNVVGERASKRIHLDDLYPNYKEALNQELNKFYYNTSITVWEKRFIQNKPPKLVITGTLWASGDYIDLKIKQYEREHTFEQHPKYPYTRISEDKSVVIIQVPALDYETGKSTCPEIKTTEELLKEKDRMEEYLWETNFQQRPTNPEALIFSWEKIRKYDEIPKTENDYCYAVIDATRKSGKDFFAMPIFKPVNGLHYEEYYLIDCLFTKTATKDMYEHIVEMIITYHITKLVIESNVTSELKQNIEKILLEKGVTYCLIEEKYNTENKSTRITNEMGVIKRQLLFPPRNRFGEQTQMGKFMTNLTTYNSMGSNANDDACFSKDTLIATKYGNKKISEIKIGDEVITPFGLKKVKDVGITGYKATIKKFGLDVTPNHKIFDKSKNKFTPIDTLTLSSSCDKISLKGMIMWRIKLLFLMEANIEEAKKVGITSNTQQKKKKEKNFRNYIEQCGNITMGKFPKDFKFITKMVISIIMTFLIWNVYRLGNIYHFMAKKIGKMKNIVKKCLLKHLSMKKNKINVENGIKVKLVESGIDNTQKIVFVNINLKNQENVSGVVKTTLLGSQMQNFVELNVNKKVQIIQKKKYVLIVGKNFIQRVIVLKHVHNNVEMNMLKTTKKIVYNMTIEDAGCYYANGVLVSNCDSLALFAAEIINGGSVTQIATPLDGIREFF